MTIAALALLGACGSSSDMPGDDDDDDLLGADAGPDIDDPDADTIVIGKGNSRDLQAPALPDEMVEAAPQETALVTGGNLLLADKGIPYAQWLEEAIDTRSSDEGLNPYEVSQYIEQDDQIIRLSGYFTN